MPNFTKTKVDDNGMRSIANQIESDLNSLAASFDRISSALAERLASAWEGTGKESFFAQYKADSEIYVAHMQAVRQLNDQLMEATGIYIEAEKSAEAAIDGIKTT